MCLLFIYYDFSIFPVNYGNITIDKGSSEKAITEILPLNDLSRTVVYALLT
jgi:hypothetical protein